MLQDLDKSLNNLSLKLNGSSLRRPVTLVLVAGVFLGISAAALATGITADTTEVAASSTQQVAVLEDDKANQRSSSKITEVIKEFWTSKVIKTSKANELIKASKVTKIGKTKTDEASSFTRPALKNLALQHSALDNLVVPPEVILPIGVKIWFNEADGRDDKLLEWNEGEAFLSLGIGHFIWHPKNSERGSWAEGFPKLVRYLAARGVKLPASLTSQQGLRAPWPSRAAFLADQHGKTATQLRQLLRKHLALQAQFLVEELLASFPDMLAVTPLEDRALVRHNFNLLLKDPKGLYAMVDYYNFKGAGTYPSLANYYKGSGLVQVLSKMRLAPPDFTPLEAFVYAAKLVLTKKFGEVPNARFQRWYKGWFNRLNSYL